MTFSPADIVFVVYLVNVLVFTGFVLHNYFLGPVFTKRGGDNDVSPPVSVLIPARDEEAAIGPCLWSVLDQTYPNIEIIVLDDESSDRTAEIVIAYGENHKNLRLINGRPLPAGWKGKNHAFHQLSVEAGGDILIFLDADCTLAPWAVESAVLRMKDHGLDMMSAFPTQRLKNIGEYFTVPVMNWFLLTFLPLRKVFTSKNPVWAAANGQFLAFTRKAYGAVGGHEAVADEVVEDMEFARLVKKRGMTMMTLLGGEGIFCRMYDSFMGGFRGFSKNFFPGFKTGPAPFVLLLSFIFASFFIPFVLACYYHIFIIICGVILLQRIVIAIKCRENPLVDVILFPFHIIIIVLIGLNSVRVTLQGKATWKNRQL